MRAPFDSQATEGLPPPLTITVSDIAQDTILCGLAGEIDLATAPRLQEKLTEAIDLAPSHLVIDLSDIAFLGSAGLNLLFEIHEAQQAAGYHLALVVGPNHAVARPFQVTALDRVLDLHAELATAVQACRVHPRPDNSPTRAGEYSSEVQQPTRPSKIGSDLRTNHEQPTQTQHTALPRVRIEKVMRQDQHPTLFPGSAAQ